VRRFWPDGILGWTRLMSGYVRDPRVGRDVLIGCVFAPVLPLLEMAYELLPPLLGRPPEARHPRPPRDLRLLLPREQVLPVEDDGPVGEFERVPDGDPGRGEADVDLAVVPEIGQRAPQ
jgi:hypothetical protein